MRKKYMAVIVFLFVGMAFWPFDTKAMPGAGGGETLNRVSDGGGVLSGQTPDAMVSGNLWMDGMRERFSLKLPEKMEVIIDPWELDGKGQVYSEQYVICNAGDTNGKLKLSFSCRVQENSGVIVRQEREGLHDDENKSVYIELVFEKEGVGQKMVLSQGKTEYQAELGPGQEMAICFAGEVNENAPGQWRDCGIVIEGEYMWDIGNIPEEIFPDREETEGKNGRGDTEEEGNKFTASGNEALGNPLMEDTMESEKDY